MSGIGARRNASRPATDAQIMRLWSEVRRCGFEGRAAFAEIQRIAGRPLDFVFDLSVAEASRVIEALERKGAGS